MQFDERTGDHQLVAAVEIVERAREFGPSGHALARGGGNRGKFPGALWARPLAALVRLRRDRRNAGFAPDALNERVYNSPAPGNLLRSQAVSA